MTLSAPHAFPHYSIGEKRADTLIHAVGVTAGVCGVAWMGAALAGADGGPARVAWSLAVYGLGLLGMLVASAAYTITRPGPRKALLRRVDHAMIFVMIAGTYTPLTLNSLNDRSLGALLCGAVWGVAAVGAALKLWFPRRFERLGLGLYLGLGWAIVTVAEPLGEGLSGPALRLIGIGGVLYTIGVGVLLLRRVPYHNALWHLLVLAAASCHFAAIAMEYIP